MTNQEYIRKRDAIATSEAPFEIREKAMKELEDKYSQRSVKEAQQQFMESQPDPIEGID